MKKKKTAPAFQSWEDVNQALRDLAEIDQHISLINATLTNEVNQLRAEAESKHQPLEARRVQLEANVREFTEYHADEFTDSKTKFLTFGEVGFRKATSIVTRNVKAILEALKQNRMIDCIKVSENIDKDELAKYDDASLEKVGAKRKTEDKFFYKPYAERIEKA